MIKLQRTVAVPGLVAHILNGTARVNIGLGASLSPAIGGWIAKGVGYSATFLLLGSFTTASFFLWIIFSKTMKAACTK